MKFLFRKLLEISYFFRRNIIWNVWIKWKTLDLERKREHLNEKYMTPTVKFFGGKIFLWGCFSFNGVGNLNFIEGTMDKYQYVDILSNNIASLAEKMGLNEYIFQQVNDPKHASAYAKEFFAAMEIAVFDWPS